MNFYNLSVLLLVISGCNSNLRVSTSSPDTSANHPKFSLGEICIDPNLDMVPTTVTLTLCSGETGQGRLDLSDAKPENIRSGTVIAGVTGAAIIESHGECSADGVSGCVTTPVFQSSSAPTCSSDGQTGCVTTSRFKSVDTDAFVEWDIRKGKTLGGKDGKLKFCKNGANTSLIDITTAPAVAGLDYYDTINDYNANGPVISQNPFADIGGDICDAANWVDLTTGGCDEASDECLKKDLLSDLVVSEKFLSANWSTAVTNCDSLSLAGHSDWRLPTHKETAQLYNSSIRAVESPNWVTAGSSDYYWTATTPSGSSTVAYVVSFTNGYSAGDPKTASNQYFCVRP